jgi:hypothetical protein
MQSSSPLTLARTFRLPLKINEITETVKIPNNNDKEEK